MSFQGSTPRELVSWDSLHSTQTLRLSEAAVAIAPRGQTTVQATADFGIIYTMLILLVCTMRELSSHGCLHTAVSRRSGKPAKSPRGQRMSYWNDAKVKMETS